MLSNFQNTNDIGVPVIRAWISNQSNHTAYATSGFGASVSPELALERAVTEAVQSAVKQPLAPTVSYAAPSMDDLVYNRNSLYGLYYFQQKDIKPSKEKQNMSKYIVPEYETVKEILDDVVSRVKKAIPNCDIVFVNLTREKIGIPVVRVIITGDIQRLSLPLITISKRLYDFQRNMGYSDKVPEYEELYMGPYPH